MIAARCARRSPSRTSAAAADPSARRPQSRPRLRVFGRDGKLAARQLDRHAADLRRCATRRTSPGSSEVARWLDNGFDAIVGADAAAAARAAREGDRLAAWPEAAAALRERRADDDAAPGAGRHALHRRGAADRRRPTRRAAAHASTPATSAASVREERGSLLLIVLAATLLVSILLSLFLARTIAAPAAPAGARGAPGAARAGRARSRCRVLPERRDEIGLLARALSDMSQALRNRIDATEAFAADVTHELKNPLASLRSAVDSLERVEDPALRRQLLDVVRARRAPARPADRRHRRGVAGSTPSCPAPGSSRSISAGSSSRCSTLWEARGAERGVAIAFARPRVGTRRRHAATRRG